MSVLKSLRLSHLLWLGFIAILLSATIDTLSLAWLDNSDRTYILPADEFESSIVEPYGGCDESWQAPGSAGAIACAQSAG